MSENVNINSLSLNYEESSVDLDTVKIQEQWFNDLTILLPKDMKFWLSL